MYADIQERGLADRGAPAVRHELVRVDAVDYPTARAAILDQLPAGWIVASYRVERDPGHHIGAVEAHVT